MLHQFIAALGEAASFASKQCSDYTRQRFLAACEEVNDEFVPKSDIINLGDDMKAKVYEYALIRTGGLDIKRMEVEFEVEADVADLGQSNDDDATSPIKVKMKRGLLSKNTHLKVKTVFEMGPRPEAANVLADLMVEKLNESIGR